MSTITLNTFAQQIVKEFAGTNAISDLDYVTQTERYVNDMIKHVLNYWEWPWRETSETQNTVSGTGTYTLASTACEIRGMRIGGTYDVPLVMRSIEQLNYDGVDLEIQGQPENFYLNGYTASTQLPGFGLWPVPNAVYPLIIYETLRAVDISSSSVIPMPEDYMAVLRDGTRHYMHRDEGDLQAAAQALQVFEAGLKLLKNRYSIQAADDRASYYNDVPRGTRVRFPGFPGRYPI